MGGRSQSLDTQRNMAESERFVGDVSGSSESEELDCSLDVFFEEEGPAIAEDGGGPSDNVPVRAYRYEAYWTSMRFLRLRLQRVQPETKLRPMRHQESGGKSHGTDTAKYG